MITAFALLLIGSLNVQKGYAADKDCANFASQKDAQIYFLKGGGKPSYNFNNLDHNHNGIACEDYTKYSSGETYTGLTLPQGTTGQTGGGTLPNTASNYPYGIVIGLVIVSIGAILFIWPLFKRRKTVL